MPTYFYECTECGEIREDDCSMMTFKEHHPNCTECNSICNYIFIATVCQFALKDGASGSWPSKGERYKKHRESMHQSIGKKQKERYKADTIVPNFNGQETGTWREAQNMAMKEVGKASASTYNSMVAKETTKK